jgi:hypothetical protein
MKVQTSHNHMAAIFCLFSITLCKLAGQDVETPEISNRFGGSDESSPSSLSAQIITVPRVYISPCPSAFRYTFNGKEWFGLLAVPSLKLGKTHKIKLLLSVGINLKSVSDG